MHPKNLLPPIVFVLLLTAPLTAWGQSSGATPAKITSAKTTPTKTTPKQTAGSKAATKGGVLTADSLRTGGLHSAAALKAIYVGDFAHAGIQPTSLAFASLLGSYMDAFSNQCSAELPADKVPITVKDCAVYRQPTNRFGAPVGVRTCAQPTRTTRPGQFADPELFDAYLGIEDAANQNSTADLIASMMSGNADPAASNGIASMASTLQGAETDSKALLTSNGCKNPALKRLQDNMARFAEDKEPILMGGVTIDNSDLPVASHLNVGGLVSDLISADAKSWLLNRFEGGVETSTPEVDSLGRLHKVQARYDNKGPSGYTGSVTITFSGGLPSCLYFGDDAKTCRRPDAGVIKAYQSGKYKSATETRTVQVSSAPPPSQATGVWQVSHAHISRDSNGRNASATASWPAVNKAGKTIGRLEVVAHCDDVSLSVTAELTGARSYELAQALRTSDIQASTRVPLLVSLNGGAPTTVTSLNARENTVEVDFEGPGYGKASDALQGFVGLVQLVNGSAFLGTESKLLDASSLKIAIPVRRGSEGDLLQLAFNPQDPGFQRFASACRKLDPAKAPDPEAELTELTNEAAAQLPPALAAELRGIVTNFAQAAKSGNEIGLSEGYTALTQKAEPHAQDACHRGDAHACQAVDTLADLRDDVITVMDTARTKRSEEAQAARLLAPAGTAVKYALPEKVMADQITPRVVLDAQLSSPVSAGGKIVLEQGSTVRFLGFVSGNMVILNAKEVIKGSQSLRVTTTQCEFPLKSDNSPFRRSVPLGSRPFSVVPGQAASVTPKYVPAGTECSVVLTKPLMLP